MVMTRSRRTRTASWETASPTMSSSTVVSTSARSVIEKRWYGWVKNKSNHAAAESAAIAPAMRRPLAATATTTMTSSKATLVLEKSDRHGSNTSETSSGATTA